MCRRTTCKRCGKPSWAGCGAHVEQVLGDVPKSQRCQCGTGGNTAGAPKAGSKKAAPAPEPTTSMGRFKAWLKQ